jgi:hypothetical protein
MPSRTVLSDKIGLECLSLMPKRYCEEAYHLSPLNGSASKVCYFFHHTNGLKDYGEKHYFNSCGNSILSNIIPILIFFKLAKHLTNVFNLKRRIY